MDASLKDKERELKKGMDAHDHFGKQTHQGIKVFEEMLPPEDPDPGFVKSC